MSPRRLVRPALFLVALLGCLALAKIWVVAPAAPILAQTATGSDENEPLPVQAAQITIPGLTIANSSPTELGNPTYFTATVPTAPDTYTYSWRFGDGNTASGSVVQHTYTTIGRFTAQVIVARGGQTDRRSTEVIIIDEPDPTAPPPPPPTGLQVVCDAGVEANNPVTCVATVQAGAGVVYTWDMGDNTDPLNGSSVTHIYDTPGPYTVQVTASNAQGSAFSSTTITIVDESITGLSFAPTAPLVAGTVVSFRAQIESGTNVTYEWTWGDGDVVVGGSEGWHVYEAPGDYEVSVRAWNSRGQVISANQFTVNAMPPSNLQFLNSSPQPAGSAVSFFATVTSSEDVTFTWDWGDGSSLESTTSTAISHIYRVPRKYVTHVRATNSGGSTEFMDIVYVGVQPPVPEAVIQWNRRIPFPGQPIRFTVCFKLPEGGCGPNALIEVYEWDFGIGSPITTTVPFVDYTYAQHGRWPVSLTATGNGILKAGDAIIVLGHGLYFPAITRIGSFQTSSQPGSQPQLPTTAAPTATITTTVTITGTQQPATPTGALTLTPLTVSPTSTQATPGATPSPNTTMGTPVSETVTQTPTLTPAPTALPTMTSTSTDTPTPTWTPGGTIPPLTN